MHTLSDLISGETELTQPKPRVLINASILDHKPSGLGRYSFEILRRLLEDSSIEYHVFTSMPELFKDREAKIIKISTFSRPSQGKLGGVARYLSGILNREIRKSQFDLIYSPTHHGLNLPAKQIITVHDLLPLKFRKTFSQEGIAYYYYKKILPNHLNMSKKIITPSENTKKDIVDNFKIKSEKILVVPCGMEPARTVGLLEKKEFAERFGISEEYILSVGTTSYPYKNSERLIRAFHIAGLSKKYMLIFCGGRKQYIQTLKKLSINLGLKERVIFLDYINSAELDSLYRHASLFIYPSLYEGFGLPPLEAMAFGCPVVCSNISSLPEVCGDGAFYVDPMDTEAIAQGMVKVIDDEILKNELKKRAIIRASRFSWEKAASNLLSTFREVLSE